MRFIQIIFNALPVFRGKLRIARLLIRNIKSEVTFYTQKKTRYTVPNLIENVSFELFVNGSYEPDIVAYICATIPKNGVFIDVGANIGALSIEVAKARQDVTVYAFEASLNIFGYLEINQKQNNLENLHIYNLAIHETSGIELPFYSPDELNGKGSFSPVFTTKSQIVKTIRLDEFFFSNNITPDFIKVDVEGYELLVLKSLSKANMQNCTVLFEFVDWAEQAANFKIGEAQKYLLVSGYKLFRFSNKELLSKELTSGYEMIIARRS
jgi:FkbM family methyltransferase